jgi:hypothetical protein
MISASTSSSTAGLAPDQRAQRRREDQRHEDRGAQHEEQGQRQEAHELPGIEFQNMNGRKADSVVSVPLVTGQNIRLPAGGEGLLLGQALGHLPVGVLHHDDAAVDEYPDGQHHAEHHHLVQR